MFASLQELIDFCVQMQLPLDTMRFALGQNKGGEPRWFYIYQDITGEWVVAKCKADGTVAERYRGRDEAKAVSIIAEKMEQEANNRGLTIYPAVEPPTMGSPPPVSHVSEPMDIPVPVYTPRPKYQNDSREPWEEKPRKRRKRRTRPAGITVALYTAIILSVILTAICVVMIVMAMHDFGVAIRNEVEQWDSRPPAEEIGDYPQDDGSDDWLYWWYWGNYGSGYGSSYGDDDDSYYDDYDYNPKYDYSDTWGYDSSDSWSYDYGSDWDSDSGWDSNDWNSWDSNWDNDW